VDSFFANNTDKPHAMTFQIFLLVLLAAALHAGWNTIVKMRGDRLVVMGLIAAAGGIIFSPGLFLFPAPAPEVWPILALSIIIRCFYSFFLCYAYDNGDLGQVYPIARGTAPLLVAIGAFIVVGENLSLIALLGIACLVTGVLSLIFDRGTSWQRNRQAIIYALLTAICIAAYTVIDGIGVRNSGSVMGFAAWLTVGDGIFLFLLAATLRGSAVLRVARENFSACCFGGLMQAGAYWIIIVALAVAPMAMVSALRETSVLFAAVLSTLILKEGMGVWRFVSASLITLGMVIMRTEKN
jgi:drug/metabolite transporter (DMT)-like permease